jgi:DNA-nicking Smr family endonuclease
MKKEKKEKHNKYADFATVEDEFDFHDKGVLTELEIKNMAHDFLWQAYQRRLYKVRIITGKGLHSHEGAVVKPVLTQYIPTLPFVRSIETAKINEGGSGALTVVLESNI